MNTLLTLLFALPLPQSVERLLDAKTRDILHEALSGERAKDHVIQITRHHRIQGSRGYRDAAHYVLGELREAGFGEKDAWIESYPSDGRVVYQTWQSPSGWDIESAELRMLEPEMERIVGYPEIAMSVVTYSNPGDVTAELVWVGAGTRDEDYTDVDVKGKFVLATGYGGAVHRLAVLEHGAAAVVCFLDDERAADHPDMLQYTGMWPKTGELERTTFGFNLTHRQGAKLRDLLLASQKVVLRGYVKGIGLEPYFMDVVVAEIRGSEQPDEYLVFSAHLDHPKESANDNASGSGAILDIARALKECIGSGRLDAPVRSLLFMWVPEWNGTMAYIDRHPELCGPALGGKFLANMNLDMVGENLELLHSKLILTRAPYSCPSVVDDVVENMAEMVDVLDVRTPRGGRSVFNWRMLPYSGGSDHMMFLDRKIPAVMFSHDPDYTHHTSEDTPDKVDPVELERCELIAAGALWYLANLESDEALATLDLALARSLGRLGQAGRSGDAKALDLALERELLGLASILAFQDGENVRARFQRSSEVLRAARAALGPAAEPAVARDERVPVRRTRGPLAFDLPESRLPPERAAWYASAEGKPLDGDVRFELANFADGVRSISDIADEVTVEFRPLPLASVARFFDDLASLELVEIRSD